jgi:hypothetical protein
LWKTRGKESKMQHEYNVSKYRAAWEKENKDRIVLLVPKGEKEQIKEASVRKGFKSMNEYIKQLIDKDIKI